MMFPKFPYWLFSLLLNNTLDLISTVVTKVFSCELKKLELYFYLNTVNLSDKIIIIKITIYFNLYKHDQKLKEKIEKIKKKFCFT